MKEFKVTAQDVYFATLVANDIPQNEAYLAIYKNLTTNVTGACNMMLRKNPQITTLIQSLKYKQGLNPENTDDMDDSSLNNYKDKDYILRKLATLEENSYGKDKKDILIAIADLQKMKNDDNKAEEERIHFYLPITCDRCPHRGVKQ
ncbi:hypothetical protein JCM10512_1586 [Bacteroides reticulotermitis JCM 10512]|uniref:Uncharacterized protein n=2 Tax=Bacteroides reticulotermitis TaxID=1133319 RepID=W4UQR9_9BACE|nr:hypothetical protein JCM10512_1586 [Bacteroides reticulotermitis JCM 10512]